MSNKFDEITKGMAQSVSRRQALRRFGIGLAGLALAFFGSAHKAQASRGCSAKDCSPPCPNGTTCRPGWWGGPCMCI